MANNALRPTVQTRAGTHGGSERKNSCDAPFGVLLVIYMFGFWCSKDSKFELFGDEALFHPNG